MDEPKHTLEDRFWRWRVVQEARVPCTYRTKPSNRYPKGIVTVAPAIVKAVLLDFAQWPLDNRITAGLGRVAHSTELLLREVQRAVKVLTEHGWIIREKQARMGATKVTRLSWDKIDAARKPYREVFTVQDAAEAEPEPEEQYPEVAAAIVALKHVGSRISAADAEWLAQTLVEEFGEASALEKIGDVPEKTLALASNPDTKSPAKYLLKCIRREYRQWVETEDWPETLSLIEDGTPGVWFGDEPLSHLERRRKEYIRLAGDEYVVGEFMYERPEWVDDSDESFMCWLPITRVRKN